MEKEKAIPIVKALDVKSLLVWAGCWMGSIILFDSIIMYKLQSTNTQYSPIEVGTLLVTVIFGIIAFIKVILAIEKAIKNKHPRAIGSLLSALSFVILLVLGVGILLGALTMYTKPKQNEVQAEKTKYTLLKNPLKIGSTGEDVSLLQSILKQDSNLYPAGIVNGYYGRLTSEAVSKFQVNNGISQTGEMDAKTISKFNEIYGTKPIVEYQKSITPTAYVAPNNTTTNTTYSGGNDSDPVVNCRSNECGTIKLKQSECNHQYICCEVGNGNWSWYSSNDKCEQAQRDFHNQGSHNNNPPPVQQNQNTNLIAVYLAYPGYTVYCPPQNASAAQTIGNTMDSKKNEWARNFNQCADNFRNSDPCFQTCRTTFMNNGCTTDECRNQASSVYGTCISACPDVNKACESVYWEQKSMISEINNLCK